MTEHLAVSTDLPHDGEADDGPNDGADEDLDTPLDVRPNLWGLSPEQMYRRTMRKIFRNGKVRLPMDTTSIRVLLPHTWPFLMLDRIVEVDPPRSIVGLKNATFTEPHYLGHFPQDAIMPGVLIAEALSQACGILVGLNHLIAVSSGEPPPKSNGVSYIAAIKSMRFKRLVRPGDQLRLDGRLETQVGGLCHMRVCARVDGFVAAEGSLTIAT